MLRGSSGFRSCECSSTIEAGLTGGGENYQAHINEALREYVNIKDRDLENTIRRVIGEELKEFSR